MKHGKRIGAGLLSLVMLLSLLSTLSGGAFAAGSGSGTKSDPWTISKSGDVKTYIEGSTMHVEGSGYTAVRAAGQTFPWDGNKTVTDLSIEGSVRVSARSFAAMQLPNLKKLSIWGDAKVSIGDFAFANNQQIEEVYINTKAGDWGESIFANTGVKDVYVEETGNSGAWDIPDETFRDCAELESITVPFCHRIGKNALAGCTSFKFFIIRAYGNGHETVGAIDVDDGNGPFFKAGTGDAWGSRGPQQWKIGNNTAYLSYGVLYLCGSGALTSEAPWDKSKVTRVYIEEGITSIPDGMFSGYTSLNRVTLPSTMKTVGAKSFSGCTGLSTVALTEGITEIRSEAFLNCGNLRSVTLPGSMQKIGSSAFGGCQDLTVYYNGSGSIWDAITIGENNNALRTATVIVQNLDNADLIDIGYRGDGKNYTVTAEIRDGNTLWICGEGETVDFDKTAAPWGSKAAQIEKIVVDSGITYLGKNIFYGMSAVKEIELPGTLLYIKENAFAGCTGITSLYFRGTLERWADVKIFEGNNALPEPTKAASFATADHPVSIGAEGGKVVAFMEGDTLIIEGEGATRDYMDEDENPPWYLDSAEIKTVKVSEGVTYLGGFLLYDLPELTEVYLPKTLKEIGWGTFCDCFALEKVAYADSESAWKLVRIGDENECMPAPTFNEKPADARVGKGAYVTPYDQTRGPSSYPNGVRVREDDGEIRYYYASMDQAIEEAYEAPLSVDDVLDRSGGGAVLKDDIPSDTVTLLGTPQGAALGRYALRNDTDGYGYDNEGKKYGIHKGIILDLKNVKELYRLSVGQLNANTVLVVKNGNLRTLDDEHMMGYCSGSIIFENMKITRDIKLANHEIYLLDTEYEYAVIGDAAQNGKIFWGNEHTLADATKPETVKASQIYFSEAYLTPYNQSAEYTGVADTVNGEQRYYYRYVGDAFAAAQQYPLSLEDVIDEEGNLKTDIATDRVTLLTDLSSSIGNPGSHYGMDRTTSADGYTVNGNRYGFAKGIVVDANGHSFTQLCPGKIDDGHILVVTSSGAPAEVTSGDILDDEEGTGHCTGTIVLNNLNAAGKLWVANHQIYLLDGTYNTDKDNFGDVMENGAVYRKNGADLQPVAGALAEEKKEEVKEEVKEEEKEPADMAAYLVPYDLSVSYPGGIEADIGGETRYYYADFYQAIEEAQQYPLTLEDVMDEDYDLRGRIATDRIVLLTDLSTGIGKAGEGGGYGTNPDGSRYGVGKGIVIDANGHSFDQVSPGLIDDGYILVITSSGKQATFSEGLDDEGGTGYCSGTVVLNNLKLKQSKMLWVANHRIYLLEGSYGHISAYLGDVMEDGAVYWKNGTTLELVAGTPDETDGELASMEAYLVPYDLSVSYPGGIEMDVDGETRYYYADFYQAIEEAQQYPLTLEDVMDERFSLYDDIATDRIVLLADPSDGVGIAGEGGGYGTNPDGSRYGIAKGIVIDMNGHSSYYKPVSPGQIDDGYILVVTSSRPGSDGNLAFVMGFDDESGTGYCSGTVVFNNLSMSYNYWVANHQIYMLDGSYYVALDKFGDVMEDGVVYRKNSAVWRSDVYLDLIVQGTPEEDDVASVLSDGDVVLVAILTVGAAAAIGITAVVARKKRKHTEV